MHVITFRGRDAPVAFSQNISALLYSPPVPKLNYLDFDIPARGESFVLVLSSCSISVPGSRKIQYFTTPLYFTTPI